ncbi:MAG: 50S ribosomal protein L11 methyltransferase [Kordiimonadaceae bacterium]|jgi:ribosomal protein L11 methyltransferase|nr:50S ribosomal protein L11 methyltransferase [Kordiimonadaceae bacterium]MBT6032523.1 50S ribosomal protein L11 methyltransferase [Kordiimonadaceae bacterium]
MNNTPQKDDDSTWKISLISPTILLPALEEILYAHGGEDFATVSDFEILNDLENRRLEAYYNNRPDSDAFKIALKQMAEIFQLPAPEFTLEKLADENWVAHSQKILKPIDAGKFYLFGCHDQENIPDNKIPILMEAGQAFGTGSHETTNGCLLAISDLYQTFKPQIGLDLGCGSGVLAIAMAKQWDVKVIASDIDPIATETAAENVAVNDVKTIHTNDNETGIATVTCDGFENSVLEEKGPYDIIVANILAAPLKVLAHDICMNLAPNGVLILSGLLNVQENEVLDAYEIEGWGLLRRYPINEWQTLVLKKK